MSWFFPPSKRPTSSEYAVLIWFISAGFIVVGLIALLAGFRAPPEKHDLAVTVEYIGAWCVGIGVAIVLGYRLARRWMD